MKSLENTQISSEDFYTALITGDLEKVKQVQLDS
jgi:hypothetical protein